MIGPWAKVWLLAASVGLLLVVACGGSAASAPTQTDTPAAVASPTPDPTPTSAWLLGWNWVGATPEPTPAPILRATPTPTVDDSGLLRRFTPTPEPIPSAQNPDATLSLEDMYPLTFKEATAQWVARNYGNSPEYVGKRMYELAKDKFWDWALTRHRFPGAGAKSSDWQSFLNHEDLAPGKGLQAEPADLDYLIGILSQPKAPPDPMGAFLWELFQPEPPLGGDSLEERTRSIENLERWRRIQNSPP